MRETWANLEWELSSFQEAGGAGIASHTLLLPYRRNCNWEGLSWNLVVVLMGWVDRRVKLILLLSPMCSMFFFFLQWWAEISLLYCYVPTRTLSSGPPLLGIHLKELKAQTHTHSCAPGFIAALFMIAKMCAQLKCPLTHEWISNTRYIHALGYHSAIKSSGVLTHAAVWQTLKTA